MLPLLLVAPEVPDPEAVAEDARDEEGRAEGEGVVEVQRAVLPVGHCQEPTRRSDGD